MLKTPLDVPQQLNRLQSHGVLVRDKAAALSVLERVSYMDIDKVDSSKGRFSRGAVASYYTRQLLSIIHTCNTLLNRV